MKIGIIGAMQVEVDLLKEKISSLTIEKEGKFEFYIGKIYGIEVIVLLSGIGKVSAAVGTTLLIERYHPDYIINTGTAGGLHSVEMGDLVIATSLGYHDADVTAFGYDLGQMAQQPARFTPDAQLLKNVVEAIQKLPEEQSVKQGLILSGDSFMSNPERVAQLKKDFPEALAVEMESAAIAQTCYQLNTPFAVVRAISDQAGEGDAQSYESFVQQAGNISAQMIIQLLSIINQQNN